MTPLPDALQERETVSPSVSQGIPRSASGSLPSFSTGALQHPPDSTPARVWISKTSLWALLIKTHNNQPHSFSQLVALGNYFPCVIFMRSSLSSSFSPLFVIRAPSPPRHPQAFSSPNHVFIHPTFHGVAFSLPLVVQFAPSTLRSISWLFRMILSLSSCVPGMIQA